MDKDGPTMRESLGPCWVWTATRDEWGYGKIGYPEPGVRKMVFAHRAAWEMENGPIPDGLLVLHRCDNPPCIRGSHLFLGTPAQNMADKVAKGRHPSKITLQQAANIRARVACGDRQSDLAREFGVSPSTVCDIVQGRRWKTAIAAIESAASKLVGKGTQDDG